MQHTGYHNLHPLVRRQNVGRPAVRIVLSPRAPKPYRPSCQDLIDFRKAQDEAWARFWRRWVREIDARVTERTARHPEGGAMRIPYDEQDTAEIRMIRAIGELNHRILLTPEPAQRTQLRLTVAALRAELVKLIETMPIHSEADVESFRATHQGFALQVTPPRYT